MRAGAEGAVLLAGKAWLLGFFSASLYAATFAALKLVQLLFWGSLTPVRDLVLSVAGLMLPVLIGSLALRARHLRGQDRIRGAVVLAAVLTTATCSYFVVAA